MTIHKSARLTPIQRKELVARYFQKGVRIATLARDYRVSRNTVYNIINRSRVNDFSIHKSVNKRYRCLEYGLKRLSKVEFELENKLKAKALRYNKSYPGEMMHSDNTLLPILEGEKHSDKPETLYVAEECPYTLEIWYTYNGAEYKGNPKEHEFMKLCELNQIKQSFTRVKTPRTNGKAERVIKTIQEMWLAKTRFKNRNHRRQELIRFINYYNTVKPHKGIGGRTPLEQLTYYFYPQEL